MRRLIWGFAGRTYHIVGNLIHWLIYSWTGANRQNITYHEDVLINGEKAFCESQYLYVLRQIFKITLTFIETLGYLSI